MIFDDVRTLEKINEAPNDFTIKMFLDSSSFTLSVFLFTV